MFRPLLLLALICAAARANGPLDMDLLDLAADLDGGKDITKKLAAFHKKHDDLGDVMKAYKPRKNGGIGYGPMAPGDGVEFAIYNLAKKGLTKEALAKQKDELLKLAVLNRVMSKLAPLYEPPSLSAVKRAAWRKQQEAMGKSAEDLAAAIRKGDPAAVRKAAEGINNSCVQCHDACR